MRCLWVNSYAGLFVLLLPSCLALEARISKIAATRWALMCADEGVSQVDLLARLVQDRQQALGALTLSNSKAAELTSPTLHCPHRLNASLPRDAEALFGFARAELDCTDQFMRATITVGRHLLQMNALETYDILHEVTRAETGYRFAEINGRSVAPGLFDEFMDFQEELAQALQGWALWAYEFQHWRYHKRPAQGDEYSHLYSPHRPPELQHVECPAVPLVYRLWTNFPTCPPTRLRDLPRFTDAYVSGMTVDNWRASYRDFLGESYDANTSFFAGGDPTGRLSKGAHSVFAGVFIQKLPTDLWCYQQVIHDLRPKYIIDLGSSQGGSAVWYASMMKLFEIPGKVISIDLALDQAYWLSKERAEKAAKRLKLESRIDWNYVVDGSKNEAVRRKVEKLCSQAPCMVVSDSDHDYAHTYYEMEWYAKLVGVGQYLVVEDTNIYGWGGWLNINDPNSDGLKKGPMEAANDFEFTHRADFVRTDWCAKHYGMSHTPNGWFFRKAMQARDLT